MCVSLEWSAQPRPGVAQREHRFLGGTFTTLTSLNLQNHPAREGKARVFVPIFQMRPLRP